MILKSNGERAYLQVEISLPVRHMDSRISFLYFNKLTYYMSEKNLPNNFINYILYAESSLITSTLFDH